MENNQSGGKQMTTTHIRTLFSNGVSSLTIKFFNTSLSLQLMAFTGKDNNGRDQYDRQRSIMTTINYEGAALLWKTAGDIIEGKVDGDSLQVDIPCNNNVIVSMVWNKEPTGQVTQLMINKNGQVIPFRFATVTYQVKQGGQVTQQLYNVGLEVFRKTIDGYLTGINAERHLNKLTDEFAKAQESRGGQQGGYQARGGYQRRNNYNQGNSYQQGNTSTPAPWENSQVNSTVGLSGYNVNEQ